MLIKKIFTVFILICLTSLYGFAAEFDTSADAEIRKNYIDGSDLPPLPSAAPGKTPVQTTDTKTSTKNSSTDNSSTKETVKSASVQKTPGKVYSIKNGTKLTLVSKSVISDSLAQGSILTFSSLNPLITKEGAIIPAGTTFRGRVTDSHGPQIGSNGGLVEIALNEVYFNGYRSQIGTKISSANSKHVAFNDVKGKHSYMKNFNRALKPGRTIFKATNNFSNVLLPVPVLNVLAVVPWAIGTVCYTVNLVFCPFIAVFSKGGKLYLPAGSEFVIKFKSNTQISA